jgi:hypothetical protein
MTGLVPEVPENERDYLATFGRLAQEWNLAESNLRGLLMRLASEDMKAFTLNAGILTAEMGSVAMENALRAFAASTIKGQVGEALEHAAKFYERLRAYRNYYVHSIVYVTAHADTGTVGGVHTFEAKGKLVERLEFISKHDLELATVQAIVLRDYVRGINLWLMAQTTEFLGELELPPKPPLPSRLRKSERHLGELFPPHPLTREKS